MNDAPKVSVCVVTYNHERYIRDCLMSVIAQSGDVSLEVLVGDDCSDDATAEIIKAVDKAHPGLIRYFKPEKRYGKGANNYLWMVPQARGEFIAYLDGDDYWLPGKLRQQVEFLEQNPHCCAVYTNALAVDVHGSPLGLFNNAQPSVIDLGYLLRGGNFLNHSSMLYRAELRDELLAIPVDSLLDYGIHLTYACRGKLGYLNQALTAYRVCSGGSMVANANERIRRLYWGSLQSLPADRVDTRDLGLGMAQFMRAVFFRGLRTRSLSLVVEWWPKILDGAPVGRFQMLTWACLSIFRVGLYELAGAVCSRINGSGMKILYRR